MSSTARNSAIECRCAGIDSAHEMAETEIAELANPIGKHVRSAGYRIRPRSRVSGQRDVAPNSPHNRRWIPTDRCTGGIEFFRSGFGGTRITVPNRVPGIGIFCRQLKHSFAARSDQNRGTALSCPRTAGLADRIIGRKEFAIMGGSARA